MLFRSFAERTDPSMSASAIAAQLNQRFAAIDEAFVAVFPPPPIQGLVYKFFCNSI